MEMEVHELHGVYSISALTGMAQERRVHRVAVMIPMKAEAAPVADELGLEEQEESSIPSPLPAKVYKGQLSDGSAEVFVVHNGTSERYGVDHIGAYMSSLSTYAVCQHIKPNIVISAGTAGGFSERGGNVGDTYLASEFRCHDSRIPLEGFDKYGECALSAARTENLRVRLTLKEGVCSSGSSLDCTEVDMGLLRKYRACAKDMEGAAVAFVSDLFHIPVMGLKTITDIVDGPRPSGSPLYFPSHPLFSLLTYLCLCIAYRPQSTSSARICTLPLLRCARS